MMRRFLAVIAFTSLLLPGLASAQPAPGPQGQCMFSTNCAASADFGSAQCCFDTNNKWYYYWNGTAFAPTGNHVTVANLPACVAAQNGLNQIATDSTTVVTEGQTCVGGSSHSALAVCITTTWQCF